MMNARLNVEQRKYLDRLLDGAPVTDKLAARIEQLNELCQRGGVRMSRHDMLLAVFTASEVELGQRKPRTVGRGASDEE